MRLIVEKVACLDQIQQYCLNLKFSALTLRAQRLCGECGLQAIHRGDAESAEAAQRKQRK